MARIFQDFVSHERFALKTPSRAYSDDGGKVWHWCSNDTVIPLDVCETHDVPCDKVAQRAARDAYLEEFTRQYKARGGDELSNEAMAELRATHGPGVEIVNVLTGRKIIT